MWEGTVAKRLGLPLFARAELEALAGLELDALTIALSNSTKLGVSVPERAGVAALHRAVRMSARHHALKVSTWERSGPALAFFYADQDRRSLAALLEGAREGSAAPSRLEGLIPTPTLTERVLDELSRQGSAGEVVSMLAAVGHPFAGRLSDGDEGALQRAWTERCRQLARRGDEALRFFVELRLSGEASVARLMASARQRAKLDPSSSATTLAVLWRIEGQTRDLSRVLWGATVGASRDLVVSELISA